ncbi:DUF2491 family protein [Burkholderia vietnamiensis]|uniref:DUF2491 family protein n=1 Tax=Burkholderia vietnamiensis TaxID=60552 RepID=UPI001588982A|nr:DUF2491 family protein [Burkholderia vietnamiensis]
MSLFNLASRIVDQKLDDAARAHAPKLDRVDTGLPFNAQIGALLAIPRVEFALLDASLLDTPKDAQLPIEAASRLHMNGDEDLKLFRLYTSVGENRLGIGGAFLQVLCGPDSLEDIRDIAYYQFLTRQFPVTAEEQSQFLGEGFGLGEMDYYMAEDQLSQINGMSDARLDALLPGDVAELHFTREGGAGQYVSPFRATENRLDDAVGDRGMKKDLSFMQYTRTLAGGQSERLLISFENVRSLDGQPSAAVYVDFLAGLALDRNKVKVL